MHPTVLASALVITASVSIAPALADIPNKDLARCAAIDNDLDRLDCYDGLAADAGVNGPSVSTSAPAGEWYVRQETSPIDDSQNAYLSVDGTATQGRYGRSATPTLHIRCKENTTSIYRNRGQCSIQSCASSLVGGEGRSSAFRLMAADCFV